MSEELASKLKAARFRLGLSQSEASKEWRIPLSTLQKWENKQNTPQGFTRTVLLEMLEKILAAPAPAIPPPPPRPGRKPKPGK